MKRLIYILSILLLLSFQVYSNGVISEQSELPEHPRLLLLKGEEAGLLLKINKDAHWKTLHNSILDESVRIIDLPVEIYLVKGKRLLDVSREVLRRVFYLSYSYRMTGEDKFARRAEKELLQVASFSDWNPAHFLDVAEMTLAVSIGYDWLYNFLSDESKKKISIAVFEKGIKPSLLKDYNSFLTNDNNWNQVCNSGITFASIAFFENDKSLAAGLINRAIESIPLSMSGYSPNGAHPEGIGYWEYGTSFNVLFLESLQQNFKADFGLSQLPGFMATGLYSQHMVTPMGNAFCYADVGLKLGFTPTPFWFYKQTKNPALILIQKQAFEIDIAKRYLRHRLLPLALIWGAGSNAQMLNAVEPDNLFWMGQGQSPVCAMRTSWTNPDGLYLGFKAGSPSSNHGHMDVGSFYFEAEQVRWALDLGMEPYANVEKAGVDLWNKEQVSQRWDVYRLNNFAHNTLTFNDRKQLVEGYAKIDTHSDKSELMYATADITTVCPPWIKKSIRSVALVNKSFVVIEDKISTGSNFSKVRWNMMTEATKITDLGNNLFLLKKDAKKMYVKIESPVKIRFYHLPASPTNSYDSPNIGIFSFGFEAELNLNSTQHFVVYLMPAKEQDTFLYKYIL